MKYRSINLALVGAAIFVMLAADINAASAQSPPPPPPPGAAPPPGAPPPPSAPPKVPRMRVACGPDVASFCPGMKSSEARKCLRAHRAELSPSCVGYLRAVRAAAKAKAMSAPPPGGPPPPAGPPPAAPPPGTPQH
jgi:hypothetical protein